MKSADDWVKEAMHRIEMSWHADYHSELIGDLEAAVAAFVNALALQPDHFEALSQKGLALARLDRHEEAAATLAQAIRLRPDHTELWLQQAESLSRVMRYEETLAACEVVLQRRAGDRDAMFLKARILAALGRDADALAAWEEVLREADLRTINLHSKPVRILTADLRRIRVRLARAGLLERLGRREEAIAAYRQLIDDGSTQASYDICPAMCMTETGRSAYHSYLQEHTGDAVVWRMAGDVFIRANRPAEALEACEKAISLAPSDAENWWYKAEALVQAGRREESIPAYQEALRLRPEYLAASARLKVVLRELGKPAEELPVPARSGSEPKRRCPECRSERVVLEGAVPEIYELKCESCGHSEIFDIMSPERESDRHWFG